jgi:hypothetical protein
MTFDLDDRRDLNSAVTYMINAIQDCATLRIAVKPADSDAYQVEIWPVAALLERRPAGGCKLTLITMAGQRHELAGEITMVEIG